VDADSATRKDRPESRYGRAARQAARAARDAGAAIVARAKLHLLDVMRRSARCAPWRSGRTVKDLEKRTGLAGPPTAAGAPLVVPLLQLLEADGLVVRRAAHYRLAPGCARRCPACGGTGFRRVRPPDTPDDACGGTDHFVCDSCNAWCGVAAAGGDGPSGDAGTSPSGAEP
jgi:hypothetical protein